MIVALTKVTKLKTKDKNPLIDGKSLIFRGERYQEIDIKVIYF